MGKLANAVIKNDLSECRELLRDEYNTVLLNNENEITDEDGFVSIFLAACFGFTEIVECLLNSGVKPNQSTKDATIVLRIAALNGHQKARECLEKDSVFIEMPINKTNRPALQYVNVTPLHLATQFNHEKIVQILISAGADPNQLIAEGSAPLHIASFYNSTDVMRALCNAGASIEKPNASGDTPLIIAAQEGHVKAVETLIKCGAQIDTFNNNEETPLHVATFNNCVDVMQVLLNAGASIEKPNASGDTPLIIATQQGHVKAIETLLLHGAQVDKPNNNGETPLYVGSLQGSLEAIQILLAAHANTDLSRKDGCRPLCIASLKNNTSAVEALINARANVDLTDGEGLTPLYIASTHGHVDVVRILLKAKPKINQSDRNAITPLHTAVRNNHINVVQELLEAGADFNQPDKERVMLLQAASDPDVRVLLQARAASGKPLLAQGMPILLQNAMSQLRALSVLEMKEVSKLGNAEYKRQYQNLREDIERQLAEWQLVGGNRAIYDEEVSILTDICQNNSRLHIAVSDLTFGVLLGKGGFGEVYKGTWQQTTVAIKKIMDIGMIPDDLESDLKNEITIMLKLRSNYIVELQGVCLEPNNWALIMEYVPKGSLDTLLKNIKRNDPELTWSIKLRLAKDIAKGLVYLHGEDILHRDIKSPNVLITYDMRAKIADFGISRLREENISTIATQTFVGSPTWVAPELEFYKPRRYNEKTDMYSYGVLLWEIATHRKPFDDASTQWDVLEKLKNDRKGEREKIPSDTPPFFKEIITWCWNQQKEKRPTAFQVLKALVPPQNIPENNRGKCNVM